MVNQKKKKKNLPVALSKEVTEMLQEIKDDLWHRQVLKVNRVNNFINLLFFLVLNCQILEI